MDLGITGKRALILGASKGLGFACAKALSSEGVDVVLSSSSLDRAQAAAASIADETGGKVLGLVGDVSVADNMNTLHAQAKEALGGPIDILLNNHGGPAIGPALELDEAELIDEFNKMVVSIIRLTDLCVKEMIAQKWGRIMTVGSAGLVQPNQNMVLSNTLRIATAYYMKSLATEVIKDGVTVNMVSPSQILTDRTRTGAVARAMRVGISPEEYIAKQEAALPAGHFGDVEDFGALVAFLSSRFGGYCTGSNWRVDGGLLKSMV